jgi:dolichyl-diphosphooligosaccharide--protein glycosyltransferase
VLVLALTPGQFLSRSVAGVYDHHIAEVFGTLLVIAVGMVVVTVAQRDKPIYEFIETREFDLLRRPVAWGVGFGAALAFTMLVWPPAVFLLGIYAIFLFVHLSVEFLRGHSPDHVAIPSTVAMVTTGLLLAPFVSTFELTTTEVSVLQLLMAVLVAGGAVFMAAVARVWDERGLTRAGYPAAVAGSGAVAAVVVAVAAPETFDFFLGQIERVAGLSSSDTAATVGEAQAPDNPVQYFFSSYGLAFYTAVLGVLVVAVRAAFAERPRAEQLLVGVFTAVMILFTMTQLRFDYYLVIGVGAANAFLVGEIFTFIDLEDVREDVTNVKPYQVLVVFAILFVVAGPLVVTAAPLAASDQATRPGEYQDWQGGLAYVSTETPELGEYGGSGPRNLEYYGTYDGTGDFEYTDGEYGVIAWWDYGHYITYGGERIPVANPFQQHATESADFLLAGNESESIEILEEDSGDGAGTRYVMIDYKLGYAGTTKYNAPVVFESRHDLNRTDIGITLADPAALQQGRFAPRWSIHTQRAYESMRVRLYQLHGSARRPANFVSVFERAQVGGGTIRVAPTDSPPIRRFNNSQEAREAAQSNPNYVHGGLFGQPGERVEALEHFRLVHASEPSSQPGLDESPIYENVRAEGPQIPYVKTFEGVDGARFVGTGPPNTEVRATVEMPLPSVNRSFSYTQFAETDDRGNFEMVVPYSTTGYDEYGPDAGYANTTVRARTDYRFVALPDNSSEVFIGQAAVTEGQVVGENDTVTRVELEGQSDVVNATEDNGSATDESLDGNGGSDDGTTTDGNGTATETQQHRGARAR